MRWRLFPLLRQKSWHFGHRWRSFGLPGKSRLAPDLPLLGPRGRLRCCLRLLPGRTCAERHRRRGRLRRAILDRLLDISSRDAVRKFLDHFPGSSIAIRDLAFVRLFLYPLASRCLRCLRSCTTTCRLGFRRLLCGPFGFVLGLQHHFCCADEAGHLREVGHLRFVLLLLNAVPADDKLHVLSLCTRRSKLRVLVELLQLLLYLIDQLLVLLLEIPAALQYRTLQAYLFRFCRLDLGQKPLQLIHLHASHRDERPALDGEVGTSHAHADLDLALNVWDNDLAKTIATAADSQVIPSPDVCHAHVLDRLLLQSQASIIHSMHFVGNLSGSHGLLLLRVDGGLRSLLHLVLQSPRIEQSPHVGASSLPLHQELLPHDVHVL
mmetsp:Transcript_139896/g.198140  ORF Transcript_139896/g.198140 Transcript_139896/m.198140 type:complete len:379 (+) Transcript_139896:256-1392(+)